MLPLPALHPAQASATPMFGNWPSYRETRHIAERHQPNDRPSSGVTYSVLTPNLKGFEAAVAAGAREVAVFAAASEGFSRKNINCSIAESIDRFVPILEAARSAGVKVRGYVSCVIACPYDGSIEPKDVARVAARLKELGCYEISLGDTVGVGTPASVLRMLEAVAKDVPVECLAGHYHDKYGMAIANIYASYQFGLRTFDSAVARARRVPLRERSNWQRRDRGRRLPSKGAWLRHRRQFRCAPDVATWIKTFLGRASG
jgi:hydroxymethylglutaryl-CoA lyase